MIEGQCYFFSSRTPKIHGNLLFFPYFSHYYAKVMCFYQGQSYTTSKIDGKQYDRLHARGGTVEPEG